ncbi:MULTISPECIES: hypothetical protein [Xenorhabdus]|uniref:hypothetical protein n=1 Tax=Xenorhabdus TaxID=626 RepID=UPI0012E06BBB|nr:MULTISPECIES: hypothetical protein [Xenorhabdus]
MNRTATILITAILPGHSPYVIVAWQPVQMLTPCWLSLKQNGHFTVLCSIETFKVEQLILSSRILDDRLSLVKLLVPIDEYTMIGKIYHKYVIDLY